MEKTTIIDLVEDIRPNMEAISNLPLDSIPEDDKLLVRGEIVRMYIQAISDLKIITELLSGNVVVADVVAKDGPDPELIFGFPHEIDVDSGE